MSFIWNGITPKFRKEITEGLINHGGLGLTYLSLFNTSLKLSWLKRLQSQAQGWVAFQIKIQYNIHKLVLYGDIFAYNTSENVQNKFGSDVAKSIVKIHAMPGNQKYT